MKHHQFTSFLFSWICAVVFWEFRCISSWLWLTEHEFVLGCKTELPNLCQTGFRSLIWLSCVKTVFLMIQFILQSSISENLCRRCCFGLGLDCSQISVLYLLSSKLCASNEPLKCLGQLCKLYARVSSAQGFMVLQLIVWLEENCARLVLESEVFLFNFLCLFLRQLDNNAISFLRSDNILSETNPANAGEWCSLSWKYPQNWCQCFDQCFEQRVF